MQTHKSGNTSQSKPMLSWSSFTYAAAASNASTNADRPAYAPQSALRATQYTHTAGTTVSLHAAHGGRHMTHTHVFIVLQACKKQLRREYTHCKAFCAFSPFHHLHSGIHNCDTLTGRISKKQHDPSISGRNKRQPLPCNIACTRNTRKVPTPGHTAHQRHIPKTRKHTKRNGTHAHGHTPETATDTNSAR